MEGNGKRDILSIIGVLSHACKTIIAGRSFLRRLIDLPVHDLEVAGQEGSTEPGCQSRPRMAVAVQ